MMTKFLPLMAQENSEQIYLKIDPMRMIGISSGIARSKVSSNEVYDSLADTVIWINCTSIVEAEEKNKIVVMLNKQLPSSTMLKISATTYSGQGNGSFGTPSSELTLSTIPQDLITKIGSCWTGVGTGNGYKVIYSWNRDNPPPKDVKVIFRIIAQ